MHRGAFSTAKHDHIVTVLDLHRVQVWTYALQLGMPSCTDAGVRLRTSLSLISPRPSDHDEIGYVTFTPLLAVLAQFLPIGYIPEALSHCELRGRAGMVDGLSKTAPLPIDRIDWTAQLA